MTDPTAPENETSQEILENMYPAAKARGQEELSHLEPGPSEPLRFGDEGIPTQLDEDPISETLPFRESLP